VTAPGDVTVRTDAVPGTPPDERLPDVGRRDRKRVLHVVQNLHQGGLERLVIDLVDAVDHRRFESHVLVVQYLGHLGQALDPSVLHQAPPLSRASLLWPRALPARIREIAPDVVHSHSGVWYKAARAARAAGVPRIIHTDHGRHHPDPWTYRMMDGLGSRFTDTVVAVSDGVAAALASGIVHDPDRIVTVINGIDTGRFSPGRPTGSLRRTLGIAEDAFVVGTIGRIEPVKAYDVLLKAFAQFVERAGGDDVALIIAGNGSQRTALEAMSRELGVDGHVRFLGWHDDVETLLANLDVFTLSSRSEGTSLSLLEAMSAGVCPVVTDVGGNGAVLGEGLRHRLVPPERPDALAVALEHARADDVRRRADAEAGVTRVRRHYSVQAMANAYEELYDR
jgi:glycosyltransferase involved in cell wall biosynthesis